MGTQGRTRPSGVIRGVMLGRVLAGALLALTACGDPAGSGDGAGADGGGSVDQDLLEQIEAVPVTPYLPELRDTRPAKVEVRDGAVHVDLDGDPLTWVLVLEPAPDVPDDELCDELGWSVSEGYDCTAEDGVVRSTFEEMSTAAVIRGDTLLLAYDLVTEVDPDLLDDAVAALEDAPEVSAEDLARY